MSKHASFILLVIAIVGAFYAGITPSFSSDDYVHLLKDTRFNDTWQALSVFQEFDGREYRPMVRISMWFNYLMSHQATPFKITNLLLHLLVTTTIYIILNKLSFSQRAALFGAAIFGLHPIHVTSVHFVMGRTDLVAAVFYFATIALVADWKDSISVRKYIFTFLTFIGALLSKEISVTLPLLMATFILYNQRSLGSRSVGYCFKVLLPFVVVAATYLMIRLIFWSKGGESVAVYTNYSLLHIITNYAQWMFGLVYPFDLYVTQDWMLAHKVLFGLIAATLAVCSLMVLMLKRQAQFFIKANYFWFGFSIAWIFITLLPLSGGNAHRWYLYIPSFGLAIIGAALIDLTSENYKKTVIAGISVLLCIYAIETTRLSSIWHRQSEITEAIFKQIDQTQLYKKDRAYIANVPFGFKSAYLFTFSSLQAAMEYRYKSSPKLDVISSMNLDETGSLKTFVKDDQIHFSLQPTSHYFVLATAMDRRFEEPETRIIGGVTLSIDKLASNKKISEYTLKIPEDIRSEFYYFDQTELKSFQ